MESELAEPETNQSADVPREAMHGLSFNFSMHVDTKSDNVYETCLGEMEKPLLISVMDSVKQKQSRAAKVLGINRGTLRKKLKKYGLI